MKGTRRREEALQADDIAGAKVLWWERDQCGWSRVRIGRGRTMQLVGVSGALGPLSEKGGNTPKCLAEG